MDKSRLQLENTLAIKHSIPPSVMIAIMGACDVLPAQMDAQINEIDFDPVTTIDCLAGHCRNLKTNLEEAASAYRGMRKAHEILEKQRPDWAKGHTSDSVAAQVMLDAKLSLWELLEVDSQTLAMQKLPRLIEEHTRMLKVLTKFGEVVTAISDQGADLSFKCDQGSESREYDYGLYCGRTVFANDLYKILMVQD
jgi:hypothetical protein